MRGVLHLFPFNFHYNKDSSMLTFSIWILRNLCSPFLFLFSATRQGTFTANFQHFPILFVFFFIPKRKKQLRRLLEYGILELRKGSNFQYFEVGGIYIIVPRSKERMGSGVWCWKFPGIYLSHMPITALYSSSWWGSRTVGSGQHSMLIYSPLG